MVSRSSTRRELYFPTKISKPGGRSSCEHFPPLLLEKLRMILLLEICASQNLAKLGGGGGGGIKCQGLKGERFRVNCVALESGFQHRLYKYRKVRN